MFSFHATKVFNTVEGGAVAFKEKKYCEKLHELKNFGIHTAEDVAAVGGNAKLDEFRAAMGICNLRRMELCLEAREKIAAHYDERLKDMAGIRLNAPREGTQSNHAYYPVYFDEKEFGKSRDEVFAQLEKHDIYARKYFYPAINEMSCYRETTEQNTPIAHDAAAHILTLPIYEGLSMEDVDRICDIILSTAHP